MWHDLVTGDLRAAALVTPQDIFRGSGSVLPVLRSFSGWIVLGAAGLVAFLVSASVLITQNPGGSQKVLTALVSALGVLGVTGAGIAAKLKDSATGVLNRLRDASNAGLAAAAATILPPGGEAIARKGIPGRDLNRGSVHSTLSGW